MSQRWTIDQLTEAVRRALDTAGYNGQGSGRVREVPDKRTIRFYTTAGLLDRPVEFRGRTAYYGPKHLLQLVAIKRLQAAGLSLVEVQQSLAGADEGRLAQWAQLPAGFWDRPANSPSSATAERPVPPRRECFWAAPPEVTPQCLQAEATLLPRPATALSLAAGVNLILEGVDLRELTPEQAAQLGSAVSNLLETLRRLELMPRGGTDDGARGHNDGRD